MLFLKLLDARGVAASLYYKESVCLSEAYDLSNHFCSTLQGINLLSCNDFKLFSWRGGGGHPKPTPKKKFHSPLKKNQLIKRSSLPLEEKNPLEARGEPAIVYNCI